jgi:glucosamine--fructose-6-phosphate aminotransferase (isomerizing)
MASEALETPQRIKEQLRLNANVLGDTINKIRAFNPKFIVMIGRGSSDHAGVFSKYLIETELQIPVSAAAPSISSLFGRSLKLNSGLVICLSQSGRSPDIVKHAQEAKSAGALCIAIVNDTESPLANIVDCVVPLHAGKETAVAATKSFLCTLSAILSLVAEWKCDSELQSDLNELPSILQKITEQPRKLTSNDLNNIDHCVVLGRGFGYAISREIALKLKEVCGIHAESFSSAEFLHGPITLVSKRLLSLNVELIDETVEQHMTQINEIVSRGGKVIDLFDASKLKGIPPRLMALVIMQQFYLDIEKIARERGVNPDTPVGLNKVTRTL